MLSRLALYRLYQTANIWPNPDGLDFEKKIATIVYVWMFATSNALYTHGLKMYGETVSPWLHPLLT